MKLPLLLLMGAILVTSCERTFEQTVESAYIDPLSLPVVHKYSFTRNGTSSVNLLELEILKDNIDAFLRPVAGADIVNQKILDEMMDIYTKGLYEVIPLEYVATSFYHAKNQATIRADIQQLIDQTASLSGFHLPSHSKDMHKKNAATKGEMGYLRDGKSKIYVNENGVVLHNFTDKVLMGAVYLDRMLNYHLNDAFLEDKTLRAAHQNMALLPGRNYTALEHHWDLAYGYFNIWRAFFKKQGLGVASQRELKIFNAFVLGRTELSRYRYKEMKEHLTTIRIELSKLLAISVIHFFTNQNTLVNLKQGDGSDAFLSISEGLGLLYALQFAANEKGLPYIAYEQMQALLSTMLREGGLWNIEKLSADANKEGSLLYVVHRVREHFGINMEEIEK